MGVSNFGNSKFLGLPTSLSTTPIFCGTSNYVIIQVKIYSEVTNKHEFTQNLVTPLSLGKWGFTLLSPLKEFCPQNSIT